MEIFKDIRRKAGESFLRKSVNGNLHRKKAMVNLKRASAVGILFELCDEKDYQTVHDYAAWLQQEKVRVKVIGFTKEERLMRQFLPVLSFDIIGKKSLNWYYKPTAKCVGDFIAIPFDICINLSSPKVLPLKFIASLSKASLKVGPYSEMDQQIYDLMIHSDDEHDQGTFLRNVHEYLTILNPKEDA